MTYGLVSWAVEEKMCDSFFMFLAAWVYWGFSSSYAMEMFVERCMARNYLGDNTCVFPWKAHNAFKKVHSW